MNSKSFFVKMFSEKIFSKKPVDDNFSLDKNFFMTDTLLKMVVTNPYVKNHSRMIRLVDSISRSIILPLSKSVLVISTIF